VVGQFIADGDDETEDRIAILMSTGGNSRIDLFALAATNPGEAGSWTANGTVNSSNPLKNFVVAYSNDFDSFGFGALGAAVNELHFSQSGGLFEEYALPFSGKQVVATAGEGGLGVDLGRLVGKGGAGGSITSISIVAQDIELTAGKGGDAQTGGGGAGGSISNGASFSSGGSAVLARLSAESTLILLAGDGGSTTGAGGKKGIGGAGGSIAGIRGELAEGELEVTAGDGGTGKGAAGGAGGHINRVQLLSKGGDLSVFAGEGGSATGLGAAGGAGGSINGLSYQLTLDEDGEAIEDDYFAAIIAGAGGTSAEGTGGAGGSVVGVSVIADPADFSYDDPTTDPPLVDLHLDSTFYLNVSAGDGANGRTGGNGGAVKDLSFQVVHDQRPVDNELNPIGGAAFFSYAIAQVTTGAGGNGSAGNGGNGGEFANGRFAGITGIDPDASPETALAVIARNGGSGTVKGGIGGSINGVTASNSPFGGTTGITINRNMLTEALLVAGNGGNGGSGDAGGGGSVSKLKLSVEGGVLWTFAGNGGTSTSAKGGAGGGIKDSTLALVSSINDAGMILQAGNAGSGATAGGAGGSLLNVNLNGPVGKLVNTMFGAVQTTLGRPISLIGGDGGNATADGGKAGAGGDITGVTQTKDVFSTISIITAGDGGSAATGVGGRGGNVANVRTVGFIGKPTAGSDRLGVFDDLGEPQGLFVGRGGSGVTAGVNGSVTGVVARQIAAIAANASGGVFAAATKVSKVKADVIGYDVDLDGLFDGATANPGTGVPVDGFLFAKTTTGVTGSRPAFTFTA
jgi:hypothetical protein